MKVLSIFGTRPEAIKMAPVVRQLSMHQDAIQSVVCVTAQHREMLDQVLRLFDISPDYDLDIMRHDQTLTQTTSDVLIRVGEVLEREQPDWVLVQGDTTTSMAASLAAFYRRIRIGHVEAGLRTWDRFRPYPEEVNRKIADVVADLHFAPTVTAKANLLHEGIDEAGIVVTGNTVIDALLWAAEQPFDVNELIGRMLGTISFDKKLILATTHRRESFGQPLADICAALKDIVRKHPDVHILHSVHPNGNVRKAVEKALADVEGVTLAPPLDYLPFVHLMKRSHLILTDSGGLQEEAPSLGVPVLVLRDVTERPEAVAAGIAQLVGTEREAIVQAVNRLLENPAARERSARTVNPYGDGMASDRIVKEIVERSLGDFSK